MFDSYSEALAYLRPPRDALWRWADEGSVLVWQDGSTIAFREEVEHVLRHLESGGLPPFSSVVFLLRACRNRGWPEGQVTLSEASSGKAALSEKLAALDKLRELPAELLSSPQRKAVLAEVIFEGTRGRRAVPAVLEALASGRLRDDTLNLPVTGGPGGSLMLQILPLLEGLKRVNAQTLRLRAATGLDELPLPADLPQPPMTSVRRLLNDLKQDAEHRGLAIVARDVLATLYLPRPLSELEELPVGGFADISNRGSPDR